MYCCQFSATYIVILFFVTAYAGPSETSVELCKLGFMRCVFGGTPVVNFQKEVTNCCQEKFNSADFRSDVDDCVMNATVMPCANGISKKCQEMMEKDEAKPNSSESSTNSSNEDFQVPDKGNNCNDYAIKYRKYMIDECIASETGKLLEYCKKLK